MPSFSNILNDYFYGAVGILRKRSQHRSKKRGENFESYENSIKIEQRKIGKPLFEERIKLEMQRPNILSLIEKDSNWKGGYMPVPMILRWDKRKRAKYRKEKL